jgi:alpha-glucosidase
VLELRRGPLVVVCNCERRPVRLPLGDVVLTSGPLDGSLLPPDTAAWVCAPG